MALPSQKTVLIMAGGTGGHVFPALAVAEDLRHQGIHVEWLGTRDGIESVIVPKHHFPIHYLKTAALRGRNFLGRVKAIFFLIVAFFQALKILLKLKPDCVLGMGGYASAPGGMVAYLLRKPLIIHEQNAIVGMTNRWLAKLASCRLEAFPNVFANRHNTFYVGNPIRADIVRLLSPKLRYEQRKGRLHVLILGGSRGANWINEALPQVLTKTSPKEWPEIWHQTGKNDLVKVRHAYQKLALSARVDEFVDDMAKAYAWADLVISRSGALTLCELMAAGVAAVLIPYPHAVDDHQTKNAIFLQQLNAAYVVAQHDAAIEKLVEILNYANQHRDQLLLMAERSRERAKTDATEQVVKHCLSYCYG